MKLTDMSTGPAWAGWVAFAIFVLLSLVLLSGHGSALISGYNTAVRGERARYDEKKLCRVTGIGMAVAALLILAVQLFGAVLPADFAYAAACVMILDVIAIILAQNTICKR